MIPFLVSISVLRLEPQSSAKSEFIVNNMADGKWEQVKADFKALGRLDDGRHETLRQVAIGDLCGQAESDERYGAVLTGMRMLKEHGADPNGSKGLAIYNASIKDHHGDVIRRLIGYRVDVNTLCSSDGVHLVWTPLIYSIKWNSSSKGTETLLELGADPNKWVQSWTYEKKKTPRLSALMFAAEFDRADLIPILLKHHAKLNARSPDTGQTALHFAVMANDTKALKELIKANADKNIKDKSGKTALDAAKQAGKSEAVKLLS